MKNHSKTFFGIALIAIFSLISNQNLNAQHRHAHPHKKHAVHRKVTHTQAVKIFKRTNRVIVHAHAALKKGKVYTGDFSKAVHHQRFAKRLYKQNKKRKALQHTRLARMYAFKTIRINKGTINNELQFTKEENEIIGANVSEAELAKELKTDQPNISFDDKKESKKELTDLEVLDTDPSDYKNK